ncbi:MAG: hypothetical protein WBG38_07810 [Nodosilinea sp.]
MAKSLHISRDLAILVAYLSIPPLLLNRQHIDTQIRPVLLSPLCSI